jgi:hypothetical protein
MNLRRFSILVLLLAGLEVFSAAQNQPRPSAAADNPVQDSSSDADKARTAPAAPLSGLAVGQADVATEDTSYSLPQIPALLGGKGISTAFVTDLERSNYLRGGINVGGAYDDNPLLDSAGSEGNASVSIFPNISIEQTTSRTRLLLGYAGGLTINQRFTSEDQGSHNLNFDSQFRMSPHVNLRVAENFSVTTGFFDSGNGSAIVAGSGTPNVSLIAPLSTQRSSLTTVETNYHFALNDLVGASGSFYDLHYTSPAQGTELTILPDSQTATGSAFWLHRLFRDNWAGASYRFERLTFTGGDETRVHSFFAVDTMKLAKHFTLTGFAGPQHSDNQFLLSSSGGPAMMQTTQANDWSFAGGVEGGWQTQRTSLFAGYSRSISDGGGLLGAVRLQNVYGSFRRELVPGWAAALNASHGSNRALVVSEGTASSINITSAGVSLERNLRKSIGFRMGYSHDFQQQYGPTFNASRNRYFVTLSYQWSKPLGM